MFWEWWLNTFTDAASAVLGLLPEDPEPFGGSFDVVVPWYTWGNSWLPLSESVDLMVLSLQVLSILAIIWVVTFIIQKLRLVWPF
jgi:hypothetical protein